MTFLRKLFGRRSRLVAHTFMPSQWTPEDSERLDEFLQSPTGKRLVIWLGNSSAVRSALVCAEGCTDREYRAGAAAQWAALASGLLLLAQYQKKGAEPKDTVLGNDDVTEKEIDEMLARMSRGESQEVAL